MVSCFRVLASSGAYLAISYILLLRFIRAMLLFAKFRPFDFAVMAAYWGLWLERNLTIYAKSGDAHVPSIKFVFMKFFRQTFVISLSLSFPEVHHSNLSFLRMGGDLILLVFLLIGCSLMKIFLSKKKKKKKKKKGWSWIMFGGLADSIFLEDSFGGSINSTDIFWLLCHYKSATFQGGSYSFLFMYFLFFLEILWFLIWGQMRSTKIRFWHESYLFSMFSGY